MAELLTRNDAMRSWFALFVLLLSWLPAGMASAQSAIILQANPVAIVDAEINGQAVRLEVDPRFFDMLFLNSEVARRLGVRPLPLLVGAVGIEGGTSVRGRIARPRIEFGRRGARVNAAILPTPVSSRADGVIGPGVLPFDVITLVLRPEQGTAREITLALEDPDIWRSEISLAGETLSVGFDPGGVSMFNRSAGRSFDRSGAIVARGELEERQIAFGLRALVQPIETGLSVLGLPLAPAYARTNHPLLGADHPDDVIVEADSARAPPPVLDIGQAALSQCFSIRVERRTRRMILRCAALG